MTHSHVTCLIHTMKVCDSVMQDSLIVYLCVCFSRMCVVFICMCVVIHSYVCDSAMQDSFTCHMTRSYMTHSYVTWLVHIWLIHMSHDSFIYDSFISDMTPSYMTHSYVTWLVHTWLIHMWLRHVTWLLHTHSPVPRAHSAHNCGPIISVPWSRDRPAPRDQILCATWLIHISDTCWTRLIYMRDTTHSSVCADPEIAPRLAIKTYVCHAWFIYVTHHMLDTTLLYARHDSSIRAPWSRDRPALRDQILCVTWRIHMWDTTHSYAWHPWYKCKAMGEVYTYHVTHEWIIYKRVMSHMNESCINESCHIWMIHV